ARPYHHWSDQSLGRQWILVGHDRLTCRVGGARDVATPRGVPRRGAPASRAAPSGPGERLSSRRALHRAQHHTGRAAGGRALTVVLRGGPPLIALDCHAPPRNRPPLGGDRGNLRRDGW